jgi:DNA-binding PadR family transcriptional regulator
MGAPSISVVQAVILQLLAEAAEWTDQKTGTAPGHELRKRMALEGIKKNGPGFYQIMGRLEDNGYVKTSDSTIIIDKKVYKQKLYQITRSGQRVLDQYRHFAKKLCLRQSFINEIKAWLPQPLLRPADGR